MFKNHPKGLLPAALANMGERFGFYTMMAILTLFLMSKFGLDKTNAGLIYSVFYFSIYILAFVGGLIADKTRNYKGTILVGLIVMALGYLLIAVPTPTPVRNVPLFLTVTCVGLFTIAFGNGLFKGNLQALVGQMYDNEKYEKMQGFGVSLFYMFINVGAIFAPLAARGHEKRLVVLAGIPVRPGSAGVVPRFPEKLAFAGSYGAVSGARRNGQQKRRSDRHDRICRRVSGRFRHRIPFCFRDRYFRHVDFAGHLPGQQTEAARPPQIDRFRSDFRPAYGAYGRRRSEKTDMALIAVYAVVIFFWFSFHQNGLTLTFFAKDYTLLKIGSLDLSAEIFQSMNPFFVVFLTPAVLAFFGWMRANGREPSTPAKIAIGMGIAATAYLVMMLGSLNLPSAAEVEAMGGLPDSESVTPFLLIGTYLILTIAELFISPLGISFVSKVAPPQYQGLMQGGWLGATAIGNQLLFIGAVLYQTIPIWLTWGMFVVVCLISMIVMFSMLKWLNRITKQ